MTDDARGDLARVARVLSRSDVVKVSTDDLDFPLGTSCRRAPGRACGL